MGDVVYLPTKSEVPKVWVCGCGSAEYYLHADGLCVCTKCNCYDAAFRVTFDPARRPPEPMKEA